MGTRGADWLVLPMGDDMHTHLRQGELMDLVTGHVRRGGIDRVLVMPNTVPPIVTCSQAAEYRRELLRRDPGVDYLMTLYLTPDVDPRDLASNAESANVVGVKLYPRGVTTNSDDGVEDLTQYYNVFKVMEDCGLTLHIHGEQCGAQPLKAEALFLPTFEDLHARFPNLKIVLEHISTAAAVSAVKGKRNVAATITAHHLRITIADVVAGDSVAQSLRDQEDPYVLDQIAKPHNFCKPIAKFAEDRAALLEVIREGHPQFFLGSDSAPHPREKKESDAPSAGVYTQPLLLAYLADTFASVNCLDKLRSFVCENAAAFFGFPKKKLEVGKDCVVLAPTPCEVPRIFNDNLTGLSVVPFLAGENLGYTASVVRCTEDLLQGRAAGSVVAEP